MKSETDSLSSLTEGNPAVSQELLRELSRVNAKLAAFGLQPSSGYSIAPALGGDLVKWPLSTSKPSANVAFGSLAEPIED